MALKAMKPFFTQTKSVLEIGCRAGRLSLELSGVFKEVTGIDLSARYIAPAVQLIEQGEVRYRTGRSVKRITLESLNLSYASQRVRFYQGDKNNLKPHFRGYDCIIINGVNDPATDLGNLAESLRERLNTGGKIVILAPSSDNSAAALIEYVRGGKSSQAFIEMREAVE
jgi:SAM-dependent methyltransferase